MQIDIGPYDPDTRTVPATFTATVDGQEIVHSRTVNARLNANGGYDEPTTRTMIEEQLALGVAAKINLGVIVNPPPAPAVDEEAPADAG